MNHVLRGLVSAAPKRAGTRAAAWAAAVFTVLLAVTLPLPAYRGPSGWVFNPRTIVTVLAFAVLAWAAFRRAWLAIGLLGLFGVWRLVIVGAVVVRLAMGRWAPEDVPSFIGVALASPLAVLWIWGLASALRARRRTGSDPSSAGGKAV
ncbi:MAG: hypothetical protein JWM27_4077 [Gemmatimonadetes bacterium]|nr:hypothetical protein [Gemmatimonadota bacterium]